MTPIIFSVSLLTMPENIKPKKSELVIGPNAVEALLEKRPAQIIRLVVQLGTSTRKVHELANAAKKLKIHVQQLPSAKLDKYNPNHQGVIAFTHSRPLDDWNDLFKEVMDLDFALIVVSAGLEDPRNLGACIRSAHALGVHSVLLPRKGGCGLTETCSKAAAGSLEKVKVCKPPVLDKAIMDLKSAGFHIAGLDNPGTAIGEAEFEPKQVLIIGGEDKGIPPYLRKHCDAICDIPMVEGAHSYNASVALSIGMYEYRYKFPLT
jgi:23S rRNA (guanosine2251-2'-O)-methyltransferase